MMTITQEASIKFDPFAAEHDRLKRTLARLRQVLVERMAAQSEVVALLADFADSVRAHFDHEEQFDGFFDNVVDEAPWLNDRTEALIDEHGELRSQLEQLQSHAINGVPSDAWWQKIHSRFEAFWLLFSRHEAQENQLVQAAFNEDIGAED